MAYVIVLLLSITATFALVTIKSAICELLVSSLQDTNAIAKIKTSINRFIVNVFIKLSAFYSRELRY
jgi:hypothetical protein